MRSTSRIDGHDNDICVGAGVEWQYLLPLLTKCGLHHSRVTSVIKDVYCNFNVWDEINRSF